MGEPFKRRICKKCFDYLKPCRCSLAAEVKALRAELASKCDLCEASTDALSWQAENESLRQAAGRLMKEVEAFEIQRIVDVNQTCTGVHLVGKAEQATALADAGIELAKVLKG